MGLAAAWHGMWEGGAGRKRGMWDRAERWEVQIWLPSLSWNDCSSVFSPDVPIYAASPFQPSVHMHSQARRT